MPPTLEKPLGKPDVLEILQAAVTKEGGCICPQHLQEILTRLDSFWTPQQLESLLKAANLESKSGINVHEFVEFVFSDKMFVDQKDGAPNIPVKITSFNVLGFGFCALPGPERQWTHFSGLLDKLLSHRDAGPDGISVVGFQEDVFVLREGQEWDDHTVPSTHDKFERFSFMREMMEEHGFTLASFSVHDGLSTSSHMLIKDAAGGQLEALLSSYHRSLFTEKKGDHKCTKSEKIKLGNSLWVKLGANLKQLSVRGEVVTFDTWNEAKKRDLVEYQMIPSRSAAKAIISQGDVDLFVASTCHLAGGKFDDRWILTDDTLTNVNTEMLELFGNDAARQQVPSVLFGDTNMKHYKFVDDGCYDPAIMGMLFGTKEKDKIQKLSAAYEGHRKFLIGEGDGEKVSEREVQVLQKAGKSPADLAKVYDIELPGRPGEIDPAAVDTLFRRVKKLWRISEVPGMKLIPPASETATSCLFGGVIDHIFYKGINLRDYRVDDGEERAMLQPSPDIKCPLDRIKASDHFPVLADFTLTVKGAPAG
eukprot:TRINITY_DN1015_c0_g1_i1.p1 TRINITY_DN1015_c0_g1~~TRINITY_DN1015_c0_g1_i1.p1  ORF type:complete len:535 (+),score=116.09 TRINITY_DN1015_c0_g1_i1:33-1637(+)